METVDDVVASFRLLSQEKKQQVKKLSNEQRRMMSSEIERDSERYLCNNVVYDVCFLAGYYWGCMIGGDHQHFIHLCDSEDYCMET